MATYRLLAAVAVLSALTGPAVAQQVISEPGYCAFFYPNANCQNKGPGNPYTDAEYKRRLNQGGSVYGSGQTVGVARKRPHSSATRMQ
ncbi:MAG: hypothetical protein J0H42_22330 [Rhizobiales bacterium]|nr:hypothetical protein [Hyphomicrobiales bacterium]